ncbi:hypothetical protein P152DRAFT_390013 [Eremomyces bilateralis CBS 781.70]|uniref:Thioesterase family protein n=1 Tax=Eremomyces bilateralis CBS 781.70 TaxID=1392243 RepID=A0A6G1GDA8_9PEZI|nr:uncharacterized protein P152DRAFT_390013 [Eremomyces bilateralis CBS 781.70]KAF1815881.1 hypothetical protein P152DRAFT_390013 [Eremomyces bilateralis CBS 781.70]
MVELALSSFAEGIAVTPIGSHEYEANLSEDWCIGSVPHGGYVTSVILAAVSKHFATTLAKQNQPHSITLHLEFMKRTQAGPATVVVKDAKLGRQTTTIHVTLSQGGKEEIVGYITQSNIHKEDGPSFETGWAMTPDVAPKPASLQALRDGHEDPVWAEQATMPFIEFRKAAHQARFFFPKTRVLRNVTDQWICFRNGEKFTQDSLGYVCDMFPQMVETLRAKNDPYGLKEKAAQEQSGEKPIAKFWYPTVLLNLDVKKALPEEGVDWLFCRIHSKQVKNGRMDLDILILDEQGDLVALSHHVALILDVSRNLVRQTPSATSAKM